MRVVVFATALALAACGPTSTAPSTTVTPTTSAPTTHAVTPAPAIDTSTPIANPAASQFWDHNLLQLMPQIDACIAKSQQARTVTYAGAYKDAVIVRLQGGDGASMDCTFSDGQAHIAPTDMSLAFPDDGKAIFIRAPGENPGGDCYVAPEVRDAHGNLLGWMIDPEGC